MQVKAKYSKSRKPENINIFCFSQCDGTTMNHDQHDVIFGGRRIYLICLGTWFISILTLLPDIMGVLISRIEHLE